MGAFGALSQALFLLGRVSGAPVKRAYPESCSANPTLPSLAANPATPRAQVISNASALFAWQLISVSAMGTPFGGHPCSDGDRYDMTCIVPDMLSHEHKDQYSEKLSLFGIDPDIVDAIASSRSGCAANLDTFVAKQHVQSYLDGLVTALTLPTLAQDKALTFCDLLDNYAMQNLLASTSIRTAICAQANTNVPDTPKTGYVDHRIQADFITAVSQLLAWQFGGTILDTRYAAEACNNDLDHLKTGLDLIGMDVNSFTDVFCKQFQTDLPPAGYVQKMGEELLTQLYGTILFGLSHDQQYQCALCQDAALDESKFGQVGLNVSDWQELSHRACSIYGYKDANTAKC